jgi:predicted phage terminase large subunit-like protein
MEISTNESPMNWLASQPPEMWQSFLARLKPQEKQALQYQWRGWRARPNQLAPAGEWRVWLILAGRGFGKTRSGAEWVREQVESNRVGRVALVGETSADVRSVMIEGDSGILAISPPDNAPLYEPSKRRLSWPNGAIAVAYSGDEPDQLRGPQHDAAWADEPAKWKYPVEAWDNLEFGLRLGKSPRVVATTTPRPIKLIRDLLADPMTVVTRGSTFENVAHLAPSFVDRMKKKYEGTRLGRQELHAEVLDDVPGALWQRENLDRDRRTRMPELQRVVVAIDPASTSGEDSDETGIIIAGKAADGHAYVVEDQTCRLSPDGWARRAVSAYHRHGADRIVAEVNNGGDMVERVIRTVDRNIAYRAVRASRGKTVRAEPVAALYEQGRVHHVGLFAALEDQMCSFTPDQYEGSPDRVDALVWCLTELMLGQRVPNIRVL